MSKQKELTPQNAPWRSPLSGLKSLFKFWSDETEEIRKDAELAQLEKAVDNKESYRTLMAHDGYKLIVEEINEQIEAHRMTLELGGADEKLIRVRIEELRRVMGMAQIGFDRGEAAAAQLEKNK